MIPVFSIEQMFTQRELRDGVSLRASNQYDLLNHEEDTGSHRDGVYVDVEKYREGGSTKKRISKSVFFGSAFVALMAVLLAAVTYSTFMQHRVGKGKLTLKVYKPDVQEAIRRLKDEAADLQEQWSWCSTSVIEAFTSLYMPSYENGPGPGRTGALDVYMKLVQHVLDEAPFQHQSVDEYVVHLRLVKFICSGVIFRLSKLRDLEELHKAGTLMPILGWSKIGVSKDSELSGDTSTFQDFFRWIVDCPVDLESLGIPEETVSKHLAKDLSAYIEALRMDSDVAFLLAEEFISIFEGIDAISVLKDEMFREANYLNTPEDIGFFDFAAFSQFLLSQQREVLTEEFFQRIADNWTDSRVASIIWEVRRDIQLQLEGNLEARRKALQYGEGGETAELDQLYALAVFLI